jgi:hypothetical protein
MTSFPTIFTPSWSWMPDSDGHQWEHSSPSIWNVHFIILQKVVDNLIIKIYHQWLGKAAENNTEHVEQKIVFVQKYLMVMM